MSRTRVLSLALGVAACGGGGSGRPPIGSPATSTGPIVITPAPEPGTAPADVIDGIAAGRDADGICFGWSPAGAVLCDVGSSSIQGGASYALAILGPTGLQRFDYYQSPEGEQFFDADAADYDRAALADAAAAAKAGDFHGWTGGPAIDVDIGETADVGGLQLRRTRTETGEDGDPETGVWSLYRDVIELRCDDTRWVPLALGEEVFGNSIGEPEVMVVQVGARLLFMGRVGWGMEGDHGGGSDAALVDPAEVCR